MIFDEEKSTSCVVCCVVLHSTLKNQLTFLVSVGLIGLCMPLSLRFYTECKKLIKRLATLLPPFTYRHEGGVDFGSETKVPQFQSVSAASSSSPLFRANE